jgi:hypothetical protein
MKACKTIIIFLIALPLLVEAQTDSTMSSDMFDLPLEQLMNLQITTATKTAGKSDVGHH